MNTISPSSASYHKLNPPTILSTFIFTPPYISSLVSCTVSLLTTHYSLLYTRQQADIDSMSFDIGKLQEKLPEWIPFAHPPNYRYVHSPTHMIDFTKLSLWVSVGAIFFNPIFWNFVARNGEPFFPLFHSRCTYQEAAASDIWRRNHGEQSG